MATQVDNRVVSLQFDNNEFEKNISSTLVALEALEKKLDSTGATDAFSNIDKSANNVNIAGIGDQVEEVSRGFSKLEIMGIAALTNITNSAVNLGKKLVTNLIQPITSGGLTRALNIEQASFQLEGLGISQSKADKEKGYYTQVMDAVLGTAYSYDVAAKAASQLAASNIGVSTSAKGVKIMNGEMKKSLVAMTGVASMTGGDFQRISDLFVKVAGNGRLMSQDLLSLSSAGLNAAAVLAKEMGVTEAEVRDMITKGKVSFQDFSDAMYSAFGKHAKDSTKMFTGALEDVKAALARIGADIFGNQDADLTGLEAARDVLNAMVPLIDIIHANMGDTLTDFGNLIANASKKTVKFIDILSLITTKDPLSFMVDYPKRFQNGMDLIGGSIKATKKDFDILNDVGITNKQLLEELGISEEDFSDRLSKGKITLVDLAKAVKSLSEEFKNDETKLKSFSNAITNIIKSHVPEEFAETVDTIKSVFSGVFGTAKNLLKIGEQFLSFLGSILKSSAPLGGIIIHIANGFVTMTDAIAKGAVKFDIFGKAAQGIEFIFSGLNKAIDFFSSALDKLLSKGQSVGKFLSDFATGFAEIGTGAGVVIGGTAIMSIVNYIKTFKTAFEDLPTLFVFMKNSFNEVGKTFFRFNYLLSEGRIALQAWQQNLNADTLSKLAIAILEIAAAMKIMASIPTEKLVGVLGFMTEAIITLSILMNLATTKLKLADQMSMLASIHAMFKISEAILLMAVAFKMIGSLDWEGMVRGIIGIGVLTSAIIILSKKLETLSKGATSFIAISVSMLILASAMQKISNISWEGLGKGIIGIIAITGSIIALSKWIDKSEGFMSVAVSMIAIGIAMKIMVSAINDLASLDFNSWLQGISGLVIMLGAIVGFSVLINKFASDASFLSLAISLVAISIALQIMSTAVATLGSLGLGELAKGIVAIGILLAGLVVACNLMNAAVPGAIAMLLVASSLAVLASVISLLANLDSESVWRSIGQIAVALLAFIGIPSILGVLSPLLVLCAIGLTAFAASAILVGKAISSIGAGLIKFTVGLTMLTNMSPSIGKLAATLGVLRLLLIPFGAACLIAAPGILAVSLAMGVLAVSFLLAGVGLNMISTSISVMTKLGDKMPSLAENIMTLAEGMHELTKGSLKLLVAGVAMVLIAGAIATMSAAILICSISLPAFSSNFKKMVSEFKDATSVTGAIDKLGKAIKTFGEDIKTTSSNGQYIIQLLDSIRAFSTVDLSRFKVPDNFKESLTELGEAINEFKVGLGGISTINMLSGSLKGFADGLIELSKLKVSDNFSINMSTMKTAIKEFVTDFPQLNSNTFNTTTIKSFAESVNNLVTSFNNATKVDTNKIGKFVKSINKFNNINVDTDSLSETTKSVTTSIKNLVKSIKNNLSGNETQLTKALKSSLSGLPGAIDSTSKTLNKKTASMLKTLKTKIDTYKGPGAGTMDAAGRNLGNGLVNGMVAKEQAVYDEGFKLGRKSVQGVKDGSKEKSPSKATEEAGIFLGEGLINGIVKISSAVKSSGFKMGEKVSNAIKSSLNAAIELANSDINISPVISPVVDMSNVNKTAKDIDGLFNYKKALTIASSININKRSESDILYDALNVLKDNINQPNHTTNIYNVDGVTYDDGTNIANAVGQLVHEMKIERRR